MIDLRFFGRNITRNKPAVIILRGAPSTGKTTVSRELKKILPNTSVISVDRVISAIIPEDLSKQDRIVAWKQMWSLGHELSIIICAHFLKKGQNLVIEEMMADKNRVEKIVNQSKSLGAYPSVFELTAPINVIRTREKNRLDQVSGKPIKELVRALDENKYPGATVVDTSKHKPKQIAKIILDKVINS